MDTPLLSSLLADHPEIELVEAFVCDLNAVGRGKWLPREKALEVAAKGLPMPRSIFALDIWGRDVADAGLAFGTGDPDGLCHEIPGSAAIMPWTERPTAQVMLTMKDSDGGEFYADPRCVLSRVVNEITDRGWTAIVATELEFYLHDLNQPALDPIRPPGGGQDRWSRFQGQVLSVDALHQHERFFADLAAACAAQGVPAETALRENGPGQYEVNLRHVADAVAAADHAVLLKRIVRGVARRHNLGATFMAKPYGDQSGSGMHIHCSLLDGAGVPILADADGTPNTLLYHAVAGIVATMPETMLVLAPHANSYRRFRPNSHAPTHADWGLDDRTAAVRIVVGGRHATRIEQRVAGADCNPYLAVAAMLAGMLEGVKNEMPLPLAGGVAGTGAPLLPREWGAAIDAFAASVFAAHYFGAPFRDMAVACKRQDFAEMLARVSDVEYDAYLGVL